MAEIPPLAQALGRLPSGLFVLTTGEGEAFTGTLVSLVQQVGFDPPVIAVAIQRGRPVETVIRDHGRFCLAVISKSGKALLAHFARGFEPGQPVLEGIESAESEVGVLYPKGVNAHLACQVIGEVAWSDHTLFCGEVVAGACHGDDPPMVHLRKNGMQY